MTTNENAETKNNTSECKDSRETKGDAVALSKKDYIAIAGMFHENMCTIEDDGTRYTTHINGFRVLNDLMQYMKQDNPRFNKARFLEKVAAPHG